MDSSVESAMAPMEDSMTGDDQDGANPEEFIAKGASSEAHPEGLTGADDEDDDEDDDDDDDDGVQVTIGTIKSSPATGGPNFNRRFSKGGGGAAKVATPVAAAENGSEVVEKQKTTIDIEAEGNINGIPVKEFDLDSILDKPWRKPGADITDYFNYGFNELTWKAYCTKQQSLRVSNGLPAIGHPNFAPDKRSGFNSSLIDTQTGRGGGGFQKKPLVIDMAKIREKFNILGDRGGAVATQQQQPPPRRMDFNKPSDSGASSIAVIGGSDSTSRRIPSQDTSGPLGIPTIGGGGSSLSKPPAPSPFMPGLDMSRPPPGFPLGAMPAGLPPGVPIPSFPQQVAAPAGGPPPTGGPPPFGAPPFGDLFAGASAPPNAAPSPFPPQMPPMSGPPGSSAMPPAGWPPAMPPAGPPPAGFAGPAAANAMPAALQRSASPTIKEEEDDEDRTHRRGHSHHRESSRQRSTSPEGRHRSRSPSRSSKDPSSSSKHHRSSEKHRDRKRAGEEGEASSSSRSHHKKSKKSEKDRDGHRREVEEVKLETE